MQTQYASGHYIEASQSALLSLQDASLKPQVTHFLNKEGYTLAKKALKQSADLLESDTSEKPIHTIEALITLLLEIQHQHIPFPQSENLLFRLNLQKKIAVSHYIESEYAQGNAAMDKALFRKAHAHFSNVSLYNFNYSNLQEKLDFCHKKAQITLALTPIQIPSDPTLEIYGCPVSNTFNKSLSTALLSAKSTYFHVSRETENATYTLEGTLEAHFQDNPPLITQNTDTLDYGYLDINGFTKYTSTRFNYTVFTVHYQVTLSFNGILIANNTHTVLRHIILEKTTSEDGSYKSIPSTLPLNALSYTFPKTFTSLSKTDPLNRSAITSRAVQLAADALSQDILSTLDKDLLDATSNLSRL